MARRCGCTPSGVSYWLSETRLLPGVWRYSAYALALVAVCLLIQQWFQWWVTEIAVTNRRVIYKKGLVRRQTNEMNMDKVESVQIDQSILGRMLDYGDVRSLAPAKASRRSAPSPAQSSLETGSRERRIKPRVAAQRFRCGGYATARTVFCESDAICPLLVFSA